MLFILLLVIILITKVNIKILNINEETDVLIKIGLIKVLIDYDLFINNLQRVTKDRSSTSIKDNINYYKIAKNIVNNSNVVINKINIIKKCNNYNITNIYLNTTYYTIYSLLKNFIISNTSNYNNISFCVVASNNEDIDFDIDIEFSLSLFIKSIILNIKNIIKIKKDMV